MASKPSLKPVLFPEPALRTARRRARQPLLLLLALVCGVLLGANPFRPSDQNPDGTARGYLKFKEILSYVDRDYVDSVDAEALSDYAIARMLERLDPHSVFIPAKQQQAASAFLQSDFDGVGVEFNIFHDTVTVVAPLSGGPAEQSGLQAGDRILAVNGEAGVGRAHQHRPDVSEAARPAWLQGGAAAAPPHRGQAHERGAGAQPHPQQLGGRGLPA